MLILRGGIPRARRDLTGKFESSNLSRDDRGREVGRICGEGFPSNKDLVRTAERVVKLVGKDLQRRARHFVDA